MFVIKDRDMSKLRSFCIILSLVILTNAVVFTYKSINNRISPLLFENIEALAQNESGKYIDCYERIVSDPTDEVMYCGTCSEIPGRPKSGMSFCLK